jgi:hypothetical protein
VSSRTINIPKGQNWDIGNYDVSDGDKLTVRAPTSASTLVNYGDTRVFGTLDVKTNLSNFGYNFDRELDVIQNGKLLLGGATDHGFITIQYGMLEFTRSPQFQQPAVGSYAASHFNSGLEFTGPGSQVKFDGVATIVATYRPELNDIVVSGKYSHQQVADIHLVNNISGYQAADFTTRGNVLTYHSSIPGAA